MSAVTVSPKPLPRVVGIHHITGAVAEANRIAEAAEGGDRVTGAVAEGYCVGIAVIHIHAVAGAVAEGNDAMPVGPSCRSQLSMIEAIALTMLRLPLECARNPAWDKSMATVRGAVYRIKRLIYGPQLPKLNPKLAANLERVFRSPPMTRELSRAIRLISPHLDFQPNEASRKFWEVEQNGACWTEYESLRHFAGTSQTDARH
jgi:hypothetical protein